MKNTWKALKSIRLDALRVLCEEMQLVVLAAKKGRTRKQDYIAALLVSQCQLDAGLVFIYI
jgi:hypothetical protein